MGNDDDEEDEIRERVIRRTEEVRDRPMNEEVEAVEEKHNETETEEVKSGGNEDGNEEVEEPEHLPAALRRSKRDRAPTGSLMRQAQG